MPKDFYQILGVDKNATVDEIRRAYHKLAHQHHPDKGGDEKKFKEINEAYQTLSNKEKRSKYDRFGNAFEGGFSGQPTWDFSSQAGPGFGFDFEGMRNGFGQGFDASDLGDIFGEMFGFGAPRKKDLKRGQDIEIDLEIPLEAVLENQEKEISLYKQVLCVRCQGKGAEPGTKVNECFSCRGTGQVQQIKKTIFGSMTRVTVCPACSGEGQRPEKLCNVCQGEGRVKGEEKIKIFIPAGVDINQVIKIAGKGEAGKKGGGNGDLYVRIFVKKHPVFKRKGDDLFSVERISFSQAALGAEIEMSILEGQKILLKVPSGTDSGKVLRISDKGMPHFQGYGRGNLYVELVVKTPKHLTKKQKELLEQLGKENL